MCWLQGHMEEGQAFGRPGLPGTITYRTSALGEGAPAGCALVSVTHLSGPQAAAALPETREAWGRLRTGRTMGRALNIGLCV